MNSEDFRDFSYPQTPSDIFLQLLFRGQTINDHHLFLSNYQTVATTLNRISSIESIKLKQQNAEVNSITEEKSYFYTPYGAIDNQLQSEFQVDAGQSHQTAVLQLCHQDKKLQKCPYGLESRKMKMERYMQKKSRRIWQKKVSYNCRKVMAESRHRTKGRFVKGGLSHLQKDQTSSQLRQIIERPNLLK